MSFRTLALFVCGAIVGLVVGTIEDRQTITTLRAEHALCTEQFAIAQRRVSRLSKYRSPGELTQAECLEDLAALRRESGWYEYTNADCAVPEASVPSEQSIAPIAPNDCIQEVLRLLQDPADSWTLTCPDDSGDRQLTCTMETTP